MLEARMLDLMFVGMGIIIACLVMWWLDRPGREPKPAIPDFVPPEWGPNTDPDRAAIDRPHDGVVR